MARPVRTELLEAGGWLPNRPELVGEVDVQSDEDGRVSAMLSRSSNALPLRVWTPSSRKLRDAFGAQPASRVIELRVRRSSDAQVEVEIRRPDEVVKTVTVNPDNVEGQRTIFGELQRFARKQGGDFNY